MPIRELRAKYGPNAKAYEAINRAVAAEIPGGEQVLDCLDDINQVCRLARDDRLPWHGRACAARGRLVDVRDAMRAEIARRYELKSGRDQ